MIQINNISKISNKKLEVCSELISDANNKRENDVIIVLVGNYKNILDSLTIHNISSNFKILSINSYEENDLSNYGKNVIIITKNHEQLNRLLNLNKIFLILEIGNNMEDIIINHIVKNSRKYEKFNIKNKNRYLAYPSNNYNYESFCDKLEGMVYYEYK